METNEEVNINVYPEEQEAQITNISSENIIVTTYGTNNSTQPTLISYDRATGVLTGAGLGTSGTVYLFDRMQNKGIPIPTSSWNSENVTLSTPVDLANLTGTTSIWLVPSGYAESNKLILHGDIAVTGYGTIYYTDDNGAIQTVAISTSAEWDSLAPANNSYGWSATIGGITLWNDKIVGLQIGPSASSAPNNFLRYCYNINQPIDLSNITIIGSYFLSDCYNFNQPLDLANITSVDQNFLSNCYAFNQPIDLPIATSIGSSFLYNCYAFDQPIKLPGVTTINQLFMGYCSSFNQPLYLPKVTHINANFLQYCFRFNQPLDLANITTLGNNFLERCYSFNQPLSLPKITTIGNNFLSNCYCFNQPLDLSKITSIGTYFLSENRSYSQKITLGTATVSTYFLYNAYSITQVNVGNSTISANNNSLGTNQSKAKIYTNGVTLTGAKASTWISALPNRTSSPYRKLINGTT